MARAKSTPDTEPEVADVDNVVVPEVKPDPKPNEPKSGDVLYNGDGWKIIKN